MNTVAETRTDLELVAAVQAGDEAAFSEIVSRYSEKAYHLALRITRNTEDAEEVLQDVFVTVFRKSRFFEGKSAFSSWLYRVTANTSLMKLRKRRQTPATSMEEISPSERETWVSTRTEDSDVNYLSTRHELRAHIEQAVAKLPDEYRQVFILRDVDGLSNEEVSEIVGLSVAAVKSRLHRSRLMLRKKLARYYSDVVGSTDDTSSFEEITAQAA